MKDLQLQTPQREPASAIRRPKSTTDLSKNLRKASKKKLSPAFKAVSGDESAILEPLKEVSEVSDDNPVAASVEASKKKPSPAFKAVSGDESAVVESLMEVSEVSDDNPFPESFENFIVQMDSMNTPSSNKEDISDLTSPVLSQFSVVTSDDLVSLNASDAKWENPGADSTPDEIKSAEAELVIKHLREALIQVTKSKNVGSSQKILKALISIIIEEINGVKYEESGWLKKKFLSKKANIVFYILVMGICVVLMFWFLNLYCEPFHVRGPPPT
ncbi:pumilio 6 [Striga asiatica]|uniref:Pumilio 6 n=1 Tax=Striga asiatica TaxID=4170 RepID=A0A5A7PFF0_STRAF|nr:pumilio 6 [Striga asiatica]